MFAHRPTVRKAWGGDPTDCVALVAAQPSMSVTELVELLDGPLPLMPEGWRLWPITREAHRILADRFVANLPPYPEGRFTGRGAVICGGGAYEAGAYVACRMLRHVGWRHPIQVWHRGIDEPVSARIRRLPGVEVVNAEAHPARPVRRTLGGWEAKMFAILQSPFEEVLYLDADCYPISDPDECFQPEHNPEGIVTWPDVSSGDHSVNWETYCLDPDGKAGINGGHYVFTKRKAWRVLQLAEHYDDHSDYYYRSSMLSSDDPGGYGDQDQVRAALHKLCVRYHRYTERPLACAFESYLQAGPQGRPLFVHRHHNKFAAPGQFLLPPRWHPGHLPMEATAWRYFLEWLTEPATSGCFPDEVPGWFTQAECDLWYRTCSGRDVLELGRYYGRSTVVAALAASRVVSIDRESAAPADFWLQRYGVRHKVWLREGEFAALVPTSLGPFSACLIDGNPDQRHVEADIAAVVPHLAAGAVIGCHNYGNPTYPEVRSVVDATAKHLGGRLIDRADFLAVFAFELKAIG
jgi:hypothetical protein